MSSDDSTLEYSFDTAGHRGQETRFVYGSEAEDSYDEPDFRGAFEADVDLVIDLEGEVGWYRPRLEEDELVAAISQAQEYTERHGIDAYNFSFRERYEPDWRRIVKAVWEGANTKPEEQLKPQQEAVADGRGTTSEPVPGHAYPGQGRTSPIGVDHSKDDLKWRSSFDASTGWPWD